MSIDFEALKAPFPAEEIEFRVQQSGVKNGKPWAMVLAYVTNRAIMNRLDEVCGPEQWKNDYKTGADGGVLCGLSIKVDGIWITKWDGADNTQVEAVKGGLSGAMKRAAVQWGMGRYLYNLPTTFVNIMNEGQHYIKVQDKVGYWDDPELPDWALPNGTKPVKKEPNTSGQVTYKRKPDDDQPVSDLQRAAIASSLRLVHGVTGKTEIENWLGKNWHNGLETEAQAQELIDFLEGERKDAEAEQESLL